jgi:uncharacterized protein
MANRFCWYELMTTDAAKAVPFYRNVVGWDAQDAGQPGMDYTLLATKEGPVAGAMTMPDAARADGGGPVWMGHVAVDDVDAYAAKVVKAGGTIHRPPTDIPGVGRFAVVADPQGAVFLLFKGNGAPPPTAGPEKPGYFGWHELMAADGPTAFDFYAGLFGWTKSQAIDMGEMGVYQLFAADGQDIGGMMTKPAAAPRPYWSYYIQVDSANAAIARLKAGGGAVVNGPHQVPGGLWTVQAQDPQGGMFALVSVNA